MNDNPLTRLISACAALYTLSTNVVKPLDLTTNSFCARGGWLSNVTLVSVGGNPRTLNRQIFDARNGLEAIRLFTPGENAAAAVIEEYPESIHLDEKRWYASTSRLRDGSIIILGGSKRKRNFINAIGNALILPR